MKLSRERRGGLLCALQIRRENLLNLGVRERLRQTFRAQATCIAQGRIGIIRNFVGMAHEVNGARLLRLRA
jgi:hypothetical protein